MHMGVGKVESHAFPFILNRELVENLFAPTLRYKQNREAIDRNCIAMAPTRHDHRAVRLLVTNDDGIDSPGLHALAQRMTELGEVVVFAPSGEYSGAGAAIGHIGQGIPEVHTLDGHPEMPDVAQVHHLDGPPGLAALLACRGLFGSPPDLVVSGINPGWNVGHAVHFSGTIGACITASACGIGGIAISQRSDGTPQRWATAAEAVVEFVDRVIERPAVLSLNVDNIDGDRIQGVRWTGLGNRIPYGLNEVTLSDGMVSFSRTRSNDLSLDVDTGAVLAGYVSVTELAPTRAAQAS